MFQFILALVLFLLSHALPSLPPVRRRLVDLGGERRFRALYSVLSLLLLVWLVEAALEAPYILLWQVPAWMYWLPAVVMVPACILLAAGISTRNPLSLGRSAQAPPPRPGIVSVTRHPVLWAAALWAGAHAIINGNLVAAVLFSTFLIIAVAGMATLDRRHRRRMGPEHWRRLAQRTSILPFAAALSGRARVDWSGIGAGRLAAGIALYVGLVAAHPYVIGLPPLPAH